MRDINEILTKKTVALQSSGIRESFDIVRTMEGAISLSVGEPDFDTPRPIREEGIYSLEHGRTFYTSDAGLDEFREEITYYIQCRFGVSYEPLSEIMVTVGGSGGIGLACHAMLDPGDKVIIPQPSHVSYEPCVRLVSDMPVIVELKERDRFKLMPKDLEKTTTPCTKFLVLPFPNNPTGSIMIEEEPAAIMEVAIRHDLHVVSGEVYTKLIYNSEAPASIIQIPGIRGRTVLINGFPKAYAMTDWCLGYTCGPEPILRQMIEVHRYTIMCAPTTSQYAAVAALRDCDAETAQMREAYNQRHHHLLERLEEMDIPYFEPRGAFYIFPDISEFGMSSEEFYTKLLTEEKVTVVPDTAFGQSGEGSVRISYAYSLEQLREAMGYTQRSVERYAN